MSKPGGLRAGDDDRARAETLLRDAAADGRLDLDELSERLGTAHRARTLAELHALTADVPARTPVAAGRVAPARHRAVLSSHQLALRTPVPGSRYSAVLGSMRLDLRGLSLGPGGEVELELRTVLGSVEVLVPGGIAVEVVPGGVMCSVDVRLDDRPLAPDAPVVRLVLGGALGSAAVHRRQSIGEQIKRAA